MGIQNWQDASADAMKRKRVIMKIRREKDFDILINAEIGRGSH